MPTERWMLSSWTSSVPTRALSILSLACLAGFDLAGLGCAGDPTSVEVTALALTTDAVVINDGSDFTRNSIVTLNITTSPQNRPRTMCVSNTSACTPEPFANQKRWLLDPGDGSKTISVTLDDGAGTVTALSAVIQLDATVPVAGTLNAAPSDGRVSLSWDVGSDALSGVGSYRLMMSSITTPPSCFFGQNIYEGPATSFEHTTVQNGGTYGYRICPIDNAGNIGVGVTASARPAPEFDPPTGSVTINTGDLMTNNAQVSLDLTASDASTVTAVCISQTATCTTNWQPYAATKPWTLHGTNGLFTLNVWFRDEYGNVSTTPATASITLDTIKPAVSTLTAQIDLDGVHLAWTAATDVNMIASYTLVWVPGKAAPPNCSYGTVVYTGTDLMYVDATGPQGFRTYKLCATDEAGNINAGAPVTAYQLVP